MVQTIYPIDDDETGYELYLKAMNLGACLLIADFDGIINNNIQPYKQKNGGSYYGKLKDPPYLEWKQGGQAIKNNVRIRSQLYNPIAAIFESKYFVINKVAIVQDDTYAVQATGEILKIYEDETLMVSCADGAVHVLEYSVYPPFTGVEKEVYLKAGRLFD